MTAEVILSALGAYALDQNDALYVTEAGSLLTTATGAAALTNRTATDRQIDILVDGHITAVGARGIDLSSTLATDVASDTIVIGSMGVVRSVTAEAINVNRSSEAIRNAGTLEGKNSGITATGNGNIIENSGSITGVFVGVVASGTSEYLTNSGTIEGRNGVSMGAGNLVNHLSTSITNTGSVIGSLFDAIRLSRIDAVSLGNSGAIKSTLFNGLETDSDIASKVSVVNHGSIEGGTGGIYIQSTGGSLKLINSGDIAGMSGIGVRLVGASGTIQNTLGAEISSVNNAAISLDQTLWLRNDGTIASLGAGTTITINGAGLDIVIRNSGLISSAAGTAIGPGVVGAIGTLKLANSGTIDGNIRSGTGIDQIQSTGVIHAATINLDAGNDLLNNLGTINGSVLMGDGDDRYLGKTGHLNGDVQGGLGNDIVLAGIEDDSLDGGAGSDSLSGGDGNDTLIGGTGTDRIIGGNGDDVITGGVAVGLGFSDDKDLLTGGTGLDVFVFRSALELGTGLTRDRITDFVHGEDRIDLQAFMPGAAFVGAAAFVNSGIGQVHYVAATGILSGDVNGDTVEDWQLQLSANLTLSAADFRF